MILIYFLLLIYSTFGEFQNQCSFGNLANICHEDDKDYFKIKPLKLGVEVSGVDLDKELNSHSDIFQSLKHDILKRRLMVFRNQTNLSTESLLMIAKMLGTVPEETYKTWRDEYRNHTKSPSQSIVRISNEKSEGYTGGGTKGFHIDGALFKKPPPFVLFYAVSAPKKGDTRYVGFREIMKIMNEKFYEKLDRLYVNHTRFVKGEWNTIIHPVLYDHPSTNEEVLCIHLGYMENLIERFGENEERTLTQEEGIEIKQKLTEIFVSNNEEFVYSHKWEQGDLLIWDNLAVAHEASKESQYSAKEVGLRILHWVSVSGETKPMKNQN